MVAHFLPTVSVSTWERVWFNERSVLIDNTFHWVTPVRMRVGCSYDSFEIWSFIVFSTAAPLNIKMRSCLYANSLHWVRQSCDHLIFTRTILYLKKRWYIVMDPWNNGNKLILSVTHGCSIVMMTDNARLNTPASFNISKINKAKKHIIPRETRSYSIVI